jgi:alcohol dehydrogenase class IV
MADTSAVEPAGMTSFRHVTPPFRVYYGIDSLRQLPVELDRLDCHRAVVFCGQTLARHPHGLALVAEALGNRYAGVFAEVTAHSPLPAVVAGMEALRALQADAVIALGGGSAVVTARASTILHAEGRDIRELCTRYSPGKQPVSPKLLQPKLPQWVVATTPTTAYAKAGTAVLDPSIGQRVTLFDPKTRAQALFVHPQLALTSPASLALDAGVQAFAMAVQGIESKSRDPLAEALLVHALRVLNRSLRKLIAEPRDAETRGQLMLGALLAGQGTDYAPSGLTSAMAHCIGARFHLANGITNALVLPHAMRFNAPATANRLALVAETLSARIENDVEAGVAAAISAVTQLFADIGLPKRLRDVGVPHDALPQLAADATGDWFLHQNPRRVRTESELIEVLDAAW